MKITYNRYYTCIYIFNHCLIDLFKNHEFHKATLQVKKTQIYEPDVW